MVTRKITVNGIEKKQHDLFHRAGEILNRTTSEYLTLRAIDKECSKEEYNERSNRVAYDMGLACEYYLKALLFSHIELKTNTGAPIDIQAKEDSLINSLTDAEVYELLVNKIEPKKYVNAYNQGKSAPDTINLHQITGITDEAFTRLSHNLYKLFDLYTQKVPNPLGTKLAEIDAQLLKNGEKDSLDEKYKEYLKNGDNFIQEPFPTSRFVFSSDETSALRKHKDVIQPTGKSELNSANQVITTIKMTEKPNLFHLMYMLQNIAEDELKIGTVITPSKEGILANEETAIKKSDDGRYYYFKDGRIQRVYKQENYSDVSFEYDERKIADAPETQDHQTPFYDRIYMESGDYLVYKEDGNYRVLKQEGGAIFKTEGTIVVPSQTGNQTIGLPQIISQIDDYINNPDKYEENRRKVKVREFIKVESIEGVTPYGSQYFGNNRDVNNYFDGDYNTFKSGVSQEERDEILHEIEASQKKKEEPQSEELKKALEKIEQLEKDNEQLKVDKEKYKAIAESMAAKLGKSLEFIEKVKNSVVGKIFFGKQMKGLPEADNKDEER